MYKERKETTHGEIGEKITTSSYIYIYKRYKYNVCYHEIVTRLMYKKITYLKGKKRKDT